MSDFVNREYQLQIQDVLTKLWGYQNFTYFKRSDINKMASQEFDALNVVDYKFEEKSSYLGTPIVMPLKMQITPRNTAIQMWDFPNEPLIEINNQKKIVETEIDGQDGTFKELYSLGDYNITIRGVAVKDSDEDEDYPEDIVRKLRTINELKNHLQVSGPLFSLFNIKYVSIYSFNLPRIEGAPSMQPYEFMCKSDKVFDLQLRKSNG
jgi:hypothetical protein